MCDCKSEHATVSLLGLFSSMPLESHASVSFDLVMIIISIHFLTSLQTVSQLQCALALRKHVQIHKKRLPQTLEGHRSLISCSDIQSFEICEDIQTKKKQLFPISSKAHQFVNHGGWLRCDLRKGHTYHLQFSILGKLSLCVSLSVC